MQSDSVLIMSNTYYRRPSLKSIAPGRALTAMAADPFEIPKSTLPKMLEETARKYPGRRASCTLAWRCLTANCLTTSIGVPQACRRWAMRKGEARRAHDAQLPQ